MKPGRRKTKFRRWALPLCREPEDTKRTLDGEVFCTDYAVLRSPYLYIAFKKIVRPNFEHALHNHPFDMVSIILRGGYLEQRRWGYAQRTRWNWIPAEDFHDIIRLHRTPTWTLVFYLKWRGQAKFQYLER